MSDELVFCLHGKQASVFPLKQEDQVAVVGKGTGCDYIFAQDAELLPRHLLVRYVSQGMYEVCPLGRCVLDNQELPREQWVVIQTGQELELSSQTSIIVRSGNMLSAGIGGDMSTEDDDLDIDIDDADSFSVDGLNDIAELQGALGKQEEQDQPDESDSLLDEEQQETTTDVGSADSITGGIAENTIVKSRYEIQRKIASGGMGTVYLAWDRQLKRKVALKLLIGDDDVQQKRFLREAQAIGKLRHNNIVAIHDMGEYQGHPFFIMDYLEGRDLKNLLRRKKQIAPREAIEWIQQIARAVEYANQKGIVHRDIKPSNIILTKDKPVLTDFGVAKDESQQTQLTTAGESLGTPAYMSPEQARGDWDEVDDLSDVYSLGTVLYELLTGQPPFSGPPVKVLQQVCTIDPPSIRRFNSDVHGDAIVIVGKAMSKEKKYRYQSVGELAADIERNLDGEVIEGKLPPSHLRIKRFIKHHKTTTLAVAICLLLFVGTVSWFFYSSYKAREDKRQRLLNNLQSAQQKLESYKNKPALASLQNLFDLFNSFSQILHTFPDSEEAMRGKYKASTMIAEYALRDKNTEFALAMYFVAGQLAHQLQDQQLEDEVKVKKVKVLQLEKDRRKLQQQEVEEALANADQRVLNEEEIRETAFLLLRYPQEILVEAKGQPEKNSEKIIEVVKECVDIRKDLRIPVKQVAPFEKEMVRLIEPRSQLVLGEIMEELLSQNAKRRLLASRLLGILRYQDARYRLIDLASKDSDPEVVRHSLRSLSLLDGGEQLILEHIQSGQLSISRLKGIGRWATNLLVELLKVQPRQQPEISEILQKISSPYVIKAVVEGTREAPEQALTAFIETLGDLGDDSVIPELKRYFRSEKKAVQLASIRALLKFPSAGLASLLIEAFSPNAAKSKDPKVREYAAKGFHTLTETSEIPRLLQLIDSHPELKDHISIAILSNMNNADTVDTLLVYLKDKLERQGTVKQEGKIAAITILGKMKAVPAVSFLGEFLDSPLPEEQQTAMQALMEIGSPASEELFKKFASEKRVNIQKQIISVLARIPGDKELEFVVRTMGDLSLHDTAVTSLKNTGDRPLGILMEILRGNRKDILKELSETRKRIFFEGIAKVLGSIGSPAIPPLLEEIINAKSEGHRKVLTSSFAYFGPEILSHLRPLLDKKQSPQKRALAVEIMSNLNFIEVLPILMQGLDDESSLVRKRCSLAIKKLSDTLVPTLLRKLQTATGEERQQILEALAVSGDQDTVELFFQLLPKEPELAARGLENAARRFRSSVTPKLIEALAKDDLREGVSKALENLGSAGKRYLQKALKDKNMERSHPHIPMLLRFYKDRRNIELLIEIMASRSKANQAARKALIEMKSAAIPKLMELAKKEPGYAKVLQGMMLEIGTDALPFAKKMIYDEPLSRIAIDTLTKLGKEAFRTTLGLLSTSRDPKITIQLIRLIERMSKDFTKSEARQAIRILQRVSSRDSDVGVRRLAEQVTERLKKNFQ